MVKTSARIDSKTIERFVIMCISSSCASPHSHSRVTHPVTLTSELSKHSSEGLQRSGLRLLRLLHVELLGYLHTNQGGRGGPPLPVLLHEYPENPSFRSDRKLAGGVNRLENSVICRQREVSIYCHQFEFLRIRSRAGGGIWVRSSIGRLRGNHLCLRLNLTRRINLEELIGPILGPEIHAVLSFVFMIRPRTQPLLIDVVEHLFQRYPILVTLAHRFLSKRWHRKIRNDK